jgi:hypothetical protein
MSESLEDAGHGQTHLRGHLIDETGDKEADVHENGDGSDFVEPPWSE